MKRLIAVVIMAMFLFVGASVASVQARPDDGGSGTSHRQVTPYFWIVARETNVEACGLSTTGQRMTREERKDMQIELAYAGEVAVQALSAEQAVCILVDLPAATESAN